MTASPSPNADLLASIGRGVVSVTQLTRYPLRGGRQRRHRGTKGRKGAEKGREAGFPYQEPTLARLA